MYRPWILFTLIFITGIAKAQTEEAVTLHSATGDLFGSLIVPANKARFNLVILQPGSGPTDRKGNNPLGVNADSYLMLANELAKKYCNPAYRQKRHCGQ
ncbi:hypothetical protein LWM68_44520 [Niabella sp. W65]|nr:hypothetical protein [Niabella sp. W65]MCH7369177.1 hypothetical protein [Niabella sp. W65]